MSPRSRHHTLLLILCFGTVYLVWGSTLMGIKIAVQKIPPLFMGGIRFEIAGVVLLLILALTGKVNWKWISQWPAWRTAIISGAIMLLLAHGLQCMGLDRNIPSGIAALIVGSTPISMVTLDRLQTRRGLPSGRVMLGMFSGLVGVCVLVGGSIMSTNLGIHIDWIGALLVLGSSLSWSAGTILCRTLPQPREPLVASALQMIVGGFMLLVVSFALESWKPMAAVPWSDSVWLALLYLTIFGSLLAYPAYMWIIRNASAPAVATYAFVNPMIAMFLGWLVLHEQLHPRIGLAAILILGGVVLMQTGRKTREDHHHSPRSPLQTDESLTRQSISPQGDAR